MTRKKQKRKNLLSTKNKSRKRISVSNKSSLNIDHALSIALQHHQNGQLNKAEKVCKKILKADPNHSDVLHLLGLIARKAGKNDVAANLISQAISISPKNEIYYYNMGNTLKDLGKLNEAISCYQKVVKLKPAFTEAYNNMAVLLKEQGRSDEAITYYRKALQLRPDDAQAHNNMGNALKDQGRPDEAIACYRKALEIKPDCVEAHYSIGNVLRGQGKVDEAITCYRKALEIEPNHAGAYCSMGNALKEQGKLAEAIASFHHAVTLDPENSSAKHQLAAVTGQTTEAAPRAYIRDLFDQYAKKFDRDLVEILGYKIPTLLRRTLHATVKNDLHFKNIIDLGCGTGLAGMEFRVIADRLSGIDISPRMIEEAKKKHVYDILLVADIIEFLNNCDEKYDLFIATDVFVYSGNLKGIFELVQNHSLNGAYFLFSTESCANNDYVLRPTARYAHSRPYIQSLAKEHGFVVKLCQSAGIRKEYGQWIMGHIFVLESVHS